MFPWRLLCACVALIVLSGCDVPNAEITGKVTYEKVPHSDISHGLEYNKSFASPVRGVEVQLIEDGTIIETDITDAQGQYKFIKKMDTFVKIRVRAELSNVTGDGDNNAWQVRVVDNTNDSALYTMETNTFEVKRESMSINLHAASGWQGEQGYTSTRAAAPFHILDKVYDIFLKLDAIGDVQLPALTINWSPNNIPQFGDVTIGEIGTSYYQNGQIFLLGAEDVDTDEYDQHVIIHEWGHFFEDKVARSDSIGGPHAGGDYLDMRVAFGEGFGNAWSAMITDQPTYQDSFDQNQATGFSIEIEDNDVINPGWFSEGSVQSLLYDIYDEASDGQDFINLGLKPIVDILTGQQKDTPAMTSIFTFMTFMKENNPSFVNDFNNLLQAQNITTDVDIWGTNATNNGSLTEALPVYLDLAVGDVIRVCTSTSQGADGNKLANHRFIKLNAPVDGSYTLTLTPSRDNDIDGYIFTNGEAVAANDDAGIEPAVINANLAQGISIADVIGYNAEGTAVAAVCFDAEFQMN
ncbi:hypothetical protein [Kangiella geojedonensis]|uniref:Putative lipoprotein n=1 Tax=Kangiella geojedonensis TaxID=914150 RepID=A0A0F6RB48_9GAMM|nr:hypothetical protein [Kangiella geojedonensis]AKE51268.1 Putative lipoprotein [Kangiella geojedonensis]